MISSLQSSRPSLQTKPTSPMNQQPIRHSTSSLSSPRNQIEAMPPFQAAALPISLRPLPIPIATRALQDASMRHPVFFTDRLIKAPTGVDAGNKCWGSPVAVGYVYEDGVRQGGAARL